jgi:hypothetical protein
MNAREAPHPHHARHLLIGLALILAGFALVPAVIRMSRRQSRQRSARRWGAS